MQLHDHTGQVNSSKGQWIWDPFILVISHLLFTAHSRSYFSHTSGYVICPHCCLSASHDQCSMMWSLILDWGREGSQKSMVWAWFSVVVVRLWMRQISPNTKQQVHMCTKHSKSSAVVAENRISNWRLGDADEAYKMYLNHWTEERSRLKLMVMSDRWLEIWNWKHLQKDECFEE